MAFVNILDSKHHTFEALIRGESLYQHSKYAAPRMKVPAIFSGTCEASTTLFST